MMIISQKAIMDELERTHETLENYPQRANLYILLANHFMGKAFNSLYHPDRLSKNEKMSQSEDQLKVYSEIYANAQELSKRLDELSKISTRYVQDRKA